MKVTEPQLHWIGHGVEATPFTRLAGAANTGRRHRQSRWRDNRGGLACGCGEQSSGECQTAPTAGPIEPSSMANAPAMDGLHCRPRRGRSFRSIDDPSARVQTWIEYGREVEHPRVARGFYRRTKLIGID